MPLDFKLARVTPIFKKKGSEDDVSNYRPISCIPHFAKLLEKVVHYQLTDYLTQHDFITVDQSAYRKGHSTETELHKVIIQLLENANGGQLSGVCFVFFLHSKMFDTISHDILLYKLHKYGIKDIEHKWFKSYLSDTRQVVKVNKMCLLSYHSRWEYYRGPFRVQYCSLFL